MKLRTVLFALVLSAAPALAALTTVEGTLLRANGNPYTGSFRISWSTFTNSGGDVIQGGFINVVLENDGDFSVTLEPNTAASPEGTRYTVLFDQLNQGSRATEYWVVPESVIAVPVTMVRSTAAPSPSSIIAPTQLGQGGAITGDALCWSGTAWEPGSCAGGVSPPFSTITSGTNTIAAMLVGSGASLGYTGTGTVSANRILNTTLTSLTGMVRMDSGVPSVVTSSTVGQVLRVTGANTMAFGALDLADTDAVTGLLPAANIDSAIARDSEIILGVTNLTTAGAVPYVSASGTLNQDATNLFWNTTDKQLCIGCNATGSTDIRLRVYSTGDTTLYADAATGNFAAAFRIDSGGGGGSGDHATVTFTKDGTNKWNIAGVWNGSTDFRIIDSDASFVSRLRLFDTTGDFAIGTDVTTDNGYRLDVQAAGTNGYLRTGTATLVPTAIASLPGSPTEGTFAYVNNANATNTCVTGGGSNRVLCIYNGSAWVAVGAGAGITSLGSQTGPTQTFSDVDDTNVTLTISSAADNHAFTLGWTGTLAAGRLNSNVVQSVVNDTNVTGSISAQALTLGWTGTLAKARQNAATVYNDAANTYSTGLQDFSAATLKVPIAAGAAPTTTGLFQYDSTGDQLHFARASTDRIIPYRSTSAPTSNNCVRWGTAGILEDAGVACTALGTTPNQTFSFTTQTTVAMAHNLATTAVIPICRDAGSPPAAIGYNSLEWTDANTVTVTFSSAQSGSCVINGAMGSGVDVTTITTTDTLGAANFMFLCDATGGAVTVNLPAVATAGEGRQYIVKKIDATANACTLDGNGAETIDGSATRAILTQNESVSLITNGSGGAWYVH